MIPLTDRSCLNSRPLDRPLNVTAESDRQLTVTADLPSTTRVFPLSFGRCSDPRKTEAWVLQSVVAPQSRMKTTALWVPDGDATLVTVSFEQSSPQPPRTAEQMIAVIAVRLRVPMRPNVELTGPQNAQRFVGPG